MFGSWNHKGKCLGLRNRRVGRWSAASGSDLARAFAIYIVNWSHAYVGSLDRNLYMWTGDANEWFRQCRARQWRWSGQSSIGPMHQIAMLPPMGWEWDASKLFCLEEAITDCRGKFQGSPHSLCPCEGHENCKRRCWLPSQFWSFSFGRSKERALDDF